MSKIIEIALKEIGIKEMPADSNKTIFGQWYGLNGVAWCGIFVSWVFNQAGLSLGHIDTDKGYHYVPSAYNHFKASGEITTKPMPGDVVMYDWNGDKLAEHTGIFLKDNGDGSFMAIEGNTSLGNDSDGGEVMQRKRYYGKTVLAFIHPKVLDNGK